jgi:hypothetical protein
MKAFQNTARYLAGFAAIGALAFGLSRVAVVNAQSSSNTPTGTFTCLINANYSGYVAKATSTSNQAVNALMVINFSSATPNTGTLVGIVVNNVRDFEKATAATSTATSTESPVKFTLTQVTPAQNVFRMVSDTPGDVPYYIAVTNGGNSLFIMSAPPSDKTHNGACQKV